MNIIVSHAPHSQYLRTITEECFVLDRHVSLDETISDNI